MPVEALWLEVGKHRRAIPLGGLPALRQVCGFGIQALTRRCCDLDINQVTYRALFNEFDRLVWRTHPYKEYGTMDGERPNRSVCAPSQKAPSASPRRLNSWT